MGASGSVGSNRTVRALGTIVRRDPLLVAATGAWAVCLLYLGLTPRLPRIGPVGGSGLSLWGHAIGTAVLAALLYLVVVRAGSQPRRAAVLVAVLATLFGVGIELLQSLTGERDPSFVDALLDAVGATGAVIVLSHARFSLETATRHATRGIAVLVAVVIIAAAFFTPPASGRTDCPTSEVDEPSPAVPVPQEESAGRVERRPVALYDFRSGSGDSVPDVSGVEPALDLRLVGSEVTWLDQQGLHFDGGAARSDAPATKVVEAVERTEALTLEMWARSDDLAQGGPARIVTISEGGEEEQVDTHLGQDEEALSVRLRATCGDFNWWTLPDVFPSRVAPVHAAMTFADGVLRTYVDGRLVEAVRVEGTLGDWDRDYPLVVGNEATLDRPFSGDVLLVAVYDRALSGAEVARNAAAGPSPPG